MSRRSDLIKQLIASDKFGPEKEREQKFLMATADLILTDLIDIAINAVEKHGPGSLVINLINDSTTFMWAESIEFDLRVSERENDEDVTEFLRNLLQKIDENDWTQNVLITLISDAGTRTFAVEAGRSQESLRAVAEEFIG
jgi:hypothetical protein